MNSSLIMQDRETDSYWSIMKGRATAGALRGTRLAELSGSEKARWADWRAHHPHTVVLSVEGREHEGDVYAGYWEDGRGFRGQRARDGRLPTKAPIFAFERGAHRYAVAHALVEGGHVAALEGVGFVFLYRPKGAPLFASTRAFTSRAGFVRDAGRWVEIESGALFDPERGRFVGGRVSAQKGLDTFWYNWSLNNPDTQLIRE